MLLVRLRGLSSLFDRPPKQSSFRKTSVHFRSRQQFNYISFAKKMPTLNIGDLLNVCIDAAHTAGNEIRKVWKSGDLGTTDKGNDDPLTKADIKSQQTIMGILQHEWPSLIMIGEEDCEIPPFSYTRKCNRVDISKIPSNFQSVDIKDICVFIDPLDATKEFTVGNLEGVITLIGISYRGEPIAGVMYQPFVDDSEGNGTTIYALKGYGYHGIARKERNDGKFVLTTTKSHNSPAVDKAIELLRPDDVIRVGGAGFKVLLVISGKADVYIFPTPGTKKWDTCGPEAILNAYGGTLTDIRGNKLLYTADVDVHNRNGFICSMSHHYQFIEKIKSSL